MLLGVAFLVVTRFIYAMAGGSHPATVVGRDVTLPCSLELGQSAENMAIEWRKAEQDKGPYVHLRRGNDDVFDDQIPSYRGRTALCGTEELRKGNISLKLSQVKLSEAGNYTCFLKGIPVTTTRLTVVTVSPVISVLGASDGNISLQCEATTWYEDANVEWWDGEGVKRTADKEPEINNKDNKHYNVRSYLTVPEHKTDTETFTCRVYQGINKAKGQSGLAGDEPPEKPDSGLIAAITIAVIAVIGCFVSVCLLVWKHREINSPTDTPTAPKQIPLILEVDEEGEENRTDEESVSVCYPLPAEKTNTPFSLPNNQANFI